LVVDDNEVNRVLAEELLRELHHTCDLAEGGQEAIECTASRVYDAILMDCQMPGTNGYQATFEIRAREGASARRTPIIALTAHAFGGEVQRVKAAGMDDLLTKPVTPQILDATLQKWMAIASTGRVRSVESETQLSSPEPVQLPAAEPANATVVSGASDDPAAGQPVLLEQRRSARLLQTFARTVPALADSLVAATRAGDIPTLRAHAHKLKGSASSVGAMRLSKLCEAIQHAADRGDHEPLAAWTHLVVEALAEVEKLLDAELQSKQSQQG
jgi:CheY-like chemotaxis protein